MTETATYIMEDARESQRLLDKVDAGAWIDQFLEPQLQNAKRFLSVGCGPAVFLRELAQRHPSMEFVGVDVSPARVKDAHERLRGIPNAHVREGNALSLPFERNTFDVVFSRFMLEYLADKQTAVNEMARVSAPGGRVLLQDLDGQLIWHFPEDAALQGMIERALQGLGASGFDPFVGRKLFHLSCKAGLVNQQVQMHPYHLYAGVINDKDFSLWQTKLEIAKPQLRAALGSEEQAQKCCTKFLEYLKRSDTLTYSCLFSVVGTKLFKS